MRGWAMFTSVTELDERLGRICRQVLSPTASAQSLHESAKAFAVLKDSITRPISLGRMYTDLEIRDDNIRTFFGWLRSAAVSTSASDLHAYLEFAHTSLCLAVEAALECGAPDGDL